MPNMRIPSESASLVGDAVALLAMAGATALAITIWAGPLLGGIYGPTYVPFKPLLWLLGAAFFVRSAAGIPYVGLWALGRAELNVVVNVIGLTITTGAALALMARFGVIGAGVGVLAAELIAAGGRWILFARQAARRRKGAAVSMPDCAPENRFLKNENCVRAPSGAPLARSGGAGL